MAENRAHAETSGAMVCPFAAFKSVPDFRESVRDFTRATTPREKRGVLHARWAGRVRVLRHQVGQVLAALAGRDRAIAGAPVGFADAVEVVQALRSVDERCPARAAAAGGAASQCGAERQRGEES